ncbi:MAG: hypothetical protein E5X05_01450 [Mesorhizobium sp.]|nr:MAG: hypothetical protein E5X05_01450 [Mesorhizobium sp.]
MQRDQQVEVMDVPQDGYGAGFIEHQARTAFRDMCRIYGFESASTIMTEIMHSEANRKRITIDG